MGRPRTKKAEPVFTFYAASLTTQQRKRLAELLGYPDFNAEQDTLARQLNARGGKKARNRTPDISLAILDVEQILGLCIAGADHVDSAPRASDYVATAKRLKKSCYSLYEQICGLSGYYIDALRQAGANAEELERNLLLAVDAATDVIGKFEGMSSKGARGESVFRLAIAELREIFRKFSSFKSTSRPKKGAFESLSPYERAELEFVSFALAAGKIRPPKYLKEQLPRLLRRAAPSASRPTQK